MTDRELKKRLKKLGIAFLLAFVVIIMLLIYILGSTKAKLSIYTSSEVTNNLQALGIEDEEFKQYLSVVGNLVDENYSQSQRILNTTIYFINNMCSSYEVQTNENGLKIYDAEVVNEIAKEINGAYVKEGFETGESYTYHKEQNIYEQNKELDKNPYCIEIKEIAKNGDKIEVTYELAIMTSEQMAEYMTGKELEFETHTVKAIIMNNTNYKYSKYFVSSIEEI